MKTLHIGLDIKIYENIDELSNRDAQLMNEAKAALQKSHSPYSKFQVGASVILENGKVLSGANQENAAYPMCLCAEMVVLSTVSSEYPSMIINTMAITVKSSSQVIDLPVPPCGACRQTIFEFEQRQQKPIRILLQGEKGAIYEIASAKDILPLSFDSSFL